MSAEIYYGDTPIKRIVRINAATLGLHCYKGYTGLSNKPAFAVTLAGPEVADIGIFKHIWSFEPAKVVFVDKKKSAYESAKKILAKEWPEAQRGLVHSDLKKALIGVYNISYLNLDFMGQYTRDVNDLLLDVGPRIQPGGIISLTFCRSHESDKNPMWKLTADFGPDFDKRRFNGYAKLATYALGFNSPNFRFMCIGKFRYHMGVILIQKVSPHYPLLAHPDYNYSEPIDVKVSLDDQDRQYRNWVCSLQNEGKNATQIGHILNLPKTRIAAWMANNTRGAYAKTETSSNLA